jgi:hypothetical protein
MADRLEQECTTVLTELFHLVGDSRKEMEGAWTMKLPVVRTAGTSGDGRRFYNRDHGPHDTGLPGKYSGQPVAVFRGKCIEPACSAQYHGDCGDGRKVYILVECWK